MHIVARQVRTSIRRVASGAALCLFLTLPVWAQLGEKAQPVAVSSESPIETVLVTAQKRGVEENAQSVPIALSAFDSLRLDQLHARNLQDLTTASPNVILSDSGIAAGFANFTIRGLGTNTTIPSIEPAVGVFVDGVYLGMLPGSVVDLFDVEDVEVLRGPQTTLFGRNTTGGAILINSRRPGDHFAVQGRMNIESGLEESLGLSIETPLAKGFRAKVAASYDNDSGWFKNRFDGRSFGVRRKNFVRPMLTWNPIADFDATLIYERGSLRGDGAVAQNPAYFHGFTVNIDNPGYNRMDWEAATLESNWHLPAGIVTNLFGYRRLDQGASDDIDAQPISLFHASNILRQHQVSDELRFSGHPLEWLDLTGGLYYFTQSFSYRERRILAGGAIDSTMGGDVTVTNYAGFAEADYHIAPQLILIAGGRLTSEEKSAEIATFVPVTAGSLCNFATESCIFNFPGPSFPGSPGNAHWEHFVPKLGFQWTPEENLQIYGSWTRGVRSGGYNVRNTSFSVPPGPYDPELEDAYEIGLKSDWLNKRVRLNGAIFRSTIQGMQSDINFADPIVGVVQVTRNAANATIQGFEVEVAAAPTDSLLLRANAGYLDGRYDSVLFDLDGGGIGASDLALNLPRLAKWSYGLGATYSREMAGDYSFQFRVDYGYRSRAAYTDNNATYLAPVEDLSAGATLALPGRHWQFSFYGRNLLDKVTDGLVSPLPASLGGGAFRTLNKGRVIGVGAQFSY